MSNYGPSPIVPFSTPRTMQLLRPGLLVLLFIAAVLIAVISGSFFVVKPTERGGVRRFGQITTAAPLQPGLHMKLPFFSVVDRAQVSLTNLHIPKFSVTTIDNQIITLDINVSYDVPDSAVFHLLYEVGRSGDADIHENILPIVQDRVSRIFASQNTNSINEKREVLQQEITMSVAQTLKELFKVDVRSLQIASIAFSQAFNDSNANAVLAKNRAVQEENNLKVVGFQAQQKVVEAEGLAKQKIAEATGLGRSIELEAQGRAKAVVLEAEADAKARELKGKGEALRLEAESKSLGGPANYISFLHARAQLQWKGAYPEHMTVLGDKTPVLLGLPSFPENRPAPVPASKP
jgi:regulator of protease activity HflC (stomatin/prohibitin superfamily)